MPQDRPPLPRNVKLLGWASCLNDIASEMIFPLLPQFLITVLGGNRFYLGIIEGVADSVASLLKLWSGAWSDRAGRRRGFVIFGYAIAASPSSLIFGGLYEEFGPLAAFGWGAGLALVAAAILLFVRLPRQAP